MGSRKAGSLDGERGLVFINGGGLYLRLWCWLRLRDPSVYEFGYFFVIFGTVAVFLVFEDCFAIAWCLGELDVSSDMNG